MIPAGAGSKIPISPTLGKTEHRMVSKVRISPSFLRSDYLVVAGERELMKFTESLKKTEVTGNENVDGIQSGVGGAVGDVLSSKGPAGIVGDGVDKGALRGNV